MTRRHTLTGKIDSQGSQGGQTSPAYTWKIVLGVGLILATLYVTVPYGAPASAVYVALGLAACFTVALAVRRRRPCRPVAWALLAGGLGLTATGDATWFWLDLRGLEPFPSVADAFYLTAYVAFIAALWMLGRLNGRDHGAFSDALIVGISAAVLGWAFLIAPYAHDPSLTVSGRVVSMAYPIADLILLPLILRLVFRHGARVVAHLLILVGGVLFLAGDVFYALGNSGGWYLPGGPVDGLWLAAYALFAAAAWHPSASLEPTSRPRNVLLSPGRLVALAAASVFAPAFILLRGGTDIEVVRVAALASVLLILLIVHRMAGLMKETRSQAAELDELSRTDPLTGAGNRRHLDSELARELSRADRTQSVVSLAYLDLDHFKRFNDARGHQAGDDLLRELVAAWQGALRPVDVLARVGGEEFVIVFPGSDSSQCEAVVERLRALVPYGQTCSAGIADYLTGETAASLIGRADRALLAGKHGGRDLIVLADSEQHVTPNPVALGS